MSDKQKNFLRVLINNVYKQKHNTLNELLNNSDYKSFKKGLIRELLEQKQQSDEKKQTKPANSQLELNINQKIYELDKVCISNNQYQPQIERIKTAATETTETEAEAEAEAVEVAEVKAEVKAEAKAEAKAEKKIEIDTKIEKTKIGKTETDIEVETKIGKIKTEIEAETEIGKTEIEIQTQMQIANTGTKKKTEALITKSIKDFDKDDLYFCITRIKCDYLITSVDKQRMQAYFIDNTISITDYDKMAQILCKTLSPLQLQIISMYKTLPHEQKSVSRAIHMCYANIFTDDDYLQLLKLTQRLTFNRIRHFKCDSYDHIMVKNDKYEIGYERYANIYYIRYYFFYMLDVDSLDDSVLERFNKFCERNPQYLFALYRTNKGYHLFCLSHMINHQSSYNIILQDELHGDPWYATFSYNYGYKVRISHKTKTDTVQPIVMSSIDLTSITELISTIKLMPIVDTCGQQCTPLGEEKLLGAGSLAASGKILDLATDLKPSNNQVKSNHYIAKFIKYIGYGKEIAYCREMLNIHDKLILLNLLFIPDSTLVL